MKLSKKDKGLALEAIDSLLDTQRRNLRFYEKSVLPEAKAEMRKYARLRKNTFEKLTAKQKVLLLDPIKHAIYILSGRLKHDMYLPIQIPEVKERIADFTAVQAKLEAP